MDHLSLTLTGRLISRKPSRVRLIVSAALGGLAGTCAMLCLDGVPFILFGILTSLAMTCTAFCTGASSGRAFVIELLRDSAILWGVGTLLGGILTSIMSVGESICIEGGDEGFLPLFLCCMLVSSFLVRLFRHTSGKRSARVTVTACGRSVTFSALSDSGCLLVEPISGMPVIVASKKALGELAEMLEREQTPLRLRMIPADGVCGHSLLRGFVPERVTVEGADTSAVVACDVGGTAYGGFDGIVPSRLVH